MRKSAAGSEGKAGGNTVLPSMMPALPNEVCSPTPARSTSATLAPRRASCSATEVPTMPAPSTIASVRAMIALSPVPHASAGRFYMECPGLGRYDPRATGARGLGSNADPECDRRGPVVDRPPGHARARGLDLLRPRGSAARGLCEALSGRDGVRAAAVFVSAHRPRRLPPVSERARPRRFWRALGHGGGAARLRLGLHPLRPARELARALYHHDPAYRDCADHVLGGLRGADGARCGALAADADGVQRAVGRSPPSRSAICSSAPRCFRRSSSA